MPQEPGPDARADRTLGQDSSATPGATHDPVEVRLRAALAPHLLLVRAIGTGGMARVYLAREPALKRLVAVKVLAGDYASTVEGRARFEREAQAVAGLSHPNIVAIHTVGELNDGTPYFIMQYVEGPSLAHRVKSEGPLSVVEARRVLGEVAAALAAAHRQKIIHRDIKPANILYEEATGRSLVSDFGIAAVAAGAGGAKEAMRLTGTGVLVGTPMYMSPEQLLAEPVSEKTDIYSLGLLAHELLLGEGPFQASSPHELIAAYLRDTPHRLSQRRPDVDTELDELVARCLEKDASKRPTADEVARRLTPGGATLLEWPAPGLEELHGKLRPVTKAYWWGAGLIVATVLSALNVGPGLESVSAPVLGVLMLVASITGVLMLLVAVRRTIRLGNQIARALRAGYGGMTVLETLSDSRGDTGNVISASREYSALDPTGRDRVRRDRVVRESLLFVGGFLALPLIVGALALGSAGALRLGASCMAVGIPVVAALAAYVVARRERARFSRARRPRPSVSQVDALRLAGPWNESFETVRAGQTMGRGAPVPANAGRISAIAAAALVVVLMLALVPVILVSAGGPVFWTVAVPRFANTRSKLFIQRAARLFRLPTDSSITPLAAGRAYYALLKAAGDSNSSGFAELPPPAPALGPLPWSTMKPDGLFPTARPDAHDGLPSTLKIMAAARAGFSRAELAYLERIAHAPHWKVADSVARAARLDYIGARYRVPFHEGAVWWEFPIPRYSGLKSLAYASVARSAWYYARQQRDSAETSLRQTISLGFALSDNATTLIEQLYGIVMVGIAREGLIEYYKAIGDPRGPRLRAQTDSLIAIVEGRADVVTNDELASVDLRNPVTARRQIIRFAGSAAEMRGMRFELLHMLAMTPCTNVRELVFGPDPDVVAVFDQARKTWARFPSDTAMLEMVYGTAERLGSIPPRRPSVGPRMLVRAARVAGAVLGIPRLVGCATLIASLG